MIKLFDPARQRKEALARYDTGAKILRQFRATPIGQRGQLDRRLRGELGCGQRMLYVLRRVAEVWTRAEYKRLLGLRRADGKLVPTGHWERIAEVDDEEYRRKLIDRVVQENLTQRQLIDEISRWRRGDDTATAAGKATKTAKTAKTAAKTKPTKPKPTKTKPKPTKTKPTKTKPTKTKSAAKTKQRWPRQRELAQTAARRRHMEALAKTKRTA